MNYDFLWQVEGLISLVFVHDDMHKLISLRIRKPGISFVLIQGNLLLRFSY